MFPITCVDKAYIIEYITSIIGVKEEPYEMKISHTVLKRRISLANLLVKDLFLLPSGFIFILDKNKKGNSNNFFVLNAPKFPGISHFNSLQWLYGYPKYGRDGCLLFQPF